ncbi:hypothetical protein Pcinc_032444 [Petrolisthes cinctipes]|uniref:Uncharacterized protein n=1 Tax=Petrolisthes cinctipes TaxID=88211 RepID=A0AAE1EU40_PETCI|nr:hypothetical protein Pcinc_032444 [Petrolisthes cinctipes]
MEKRERWRREKDGEGRKMEKRERWIREKDGEEKDEEKDGQERKMEKRERWRREKDGDTHGTSPSSTPHSLIQHQQFEGLTGIQMADIF